MDMLNGDDESGGRPSYTSSGGRKRKKIEKSTKVYKTLTFEEVKAREQKYYTRLMELKYCLQYIDEAIEDVAAIDEKRMSNEKWNAYVGCDPLPKPYQPPKIHSFLIKMQYGENANVTRTYDWTLAVDELSILSQNLNRKDKTRRTLAQTIKPEIGRQYEEMVGNCLEILKRISYYMANDTEVAKASTSVLEDVAAFKVTLQKEIKNSFNRYTYRILRCPEAYMTSLDAISEDYYYSCDYFNIHIWSLKRVPLRLTHLTENRMIATLHNLNLYLHIPYSMLQNELTIQAIHMNFDHLSEYAKTYSQNITVPTAHLNAGIQDLPESVVNEWVMQTRIQKLIRLQIVQNYEDYEEKMHEYEEYLKNMEREKAENKDRKKQKLKPPPVEPPTLGTDEYPDVYEDFLEEDVKQYKHFMETVYSPKNFNLHSHQINLKKYSILGGIYQIFYVDKPVHTDLGKLNMTWHSFEKQLIVNEDVKVERLHALRSNFSRVTVLAEDLRNASKFNSLHPEIHALKESISEDCPWFVVIFELPEHLCLWGTPIPCHYEFFEDEIEVCLPRTTHSNSDLLRQKSIRTFNSRVKVKTPLTKSELHLLDNKLDKLNEVLLSKRNSFFRKSKSNFFSASIFTSRVTVDSRFTFTNDSNIVDVKDFYLNDLTTPNVHTIERHCVEQILPSYKFSKEIGEEAAEMDKKKRRSKYGILKRPRSKIFAPDGHDVFTFDENQNKPEYVFPHYSETETVRIQGQLENFEKSLPSQPKTFYQLVSTVLYIKKILRENVQHILGLDPFVSKIDVTTNKRKIKPKSKHRTNLAIQEPKNQLVGAPLSKKRSRGTSVMAFGSHQHLRKSDERNQLTKLDSLKSESSLRPNTRKIEYYHWTTRHIKRTRFERENRKLTIETDRLGYIGFAFEIYEHFPFKRWELQPSETDPQNTVTFTLDTQHVRCVLNVSSSGISGYVTEVTKGYVRNPKLYLVIEEPLQDYTEVKRRFKEKNINIFAAHDACYYIKNGYFSEKHLATEMHTYCCMAVHCTEMKFSSSQWNRLAQRREIILEFIQYEDNTWNQVTAHITPEEARFVEISELCSNDLNVITLNITPTWRNVVPYCDLHHLICSMYPAATEVRCKNSKLLCYLRDLLQEIRPLSFS